MEVSSVKEQPKIEKQNSQVTKEENLTKIITPRKSSTIKKRSLTSSISGLRKQFNEIEEKVHKDEQQLINSNSKFSSRLLEEKWMNFAETRKKEGKMGL